MRRYNTQAEINEIPNVRFKRQAICQNYIKYGDECDPQVYFSNQLEANPNLLAWLFGDETLVGKSYLSLSAERFEAFQDFYCARESRCDPFANLKVTPLQVTFAKV